MKQSHFTTVLPAFATPPLPLVSIKDMYKIILPGIDQLLFQLALPLSLSPTQAHRENVWSTCTCAFSGDSHQHLRCQENAPHL